MRRVCCRWLFVRFMELFLDFSEEFRRTTLLRRKFRLRGGIIIVSLAYSVVVIDTYVGFPGGDESDELGFTDDDDDLLTDERTLLSADAI